MDNRLGAFNRLLGVCVCVCTQVHMINMPSYSRHLSAICFTIQ